MQDKTMTFSIYEDKEDETRRILTQVYDALKHKGYNPINQIVGYIPVSYTHLDVYKRQLRDAGVRQPHARL